MTKDEFEKLEILATPDDKIRLRVLYSATIETLKSLNSKYSQLSLKNWQSSEAALEEFVAKISIHKTQLFTTVKEVYDFLKLGYPRIVRSTTYNHFKKGILAKNEQGFFDIDSIEVYAKKYIKKVSVINDDGDLKTDPDFRFKVARADEQEFKTGVLKGNLMQVVECDRRLSMVIIGMKSVLVNFARTAASDLLRISKSDLIYIPDITEYLLEHIESCLAEIAAEKSITIHAKYLLEILEKETQ